MNELTVEGRPLSVSNLDKVLYPSTGFTKGQVIDYYLRIAPVLLPHLRGRPLTLKRYPDGVTGPFFYEKRCPPHPAWLRTVAVPSERRGTIDYCVIDDLAGLVWAANLADLELHVPLHRAERPEEPDLMVFDLDPGAPADLVDCCRVAIDLRARLDAFGLSALVKTSGAKGLQLYVPIGGGARYGETKTFARELAQCLEADDPRHVVSNMRKELRTGKVFIDWSQNDPHKTTICVYSLRARERPTVSLPVTWREVQAVAHHGRSEAIVFEADDALSRVARKGDLFAPALKAPQRLPGAPSAAGPGRRAGRARRKGTAPGGAARRRHRLRRDGPGPPRAASPRRP